MELTWGCARAPGWSGSVRPLLRVNCSRARPEGASAGGGPIVSLPYVPMPLQPTICC